MMIKILFTGIGRRVELVQAFRDAAETLGVDLKLYGADMKETAPALRYCDFTRLVVPIKDKDYIPGLIKICADDKIDLLIPLIDTDLLLLSRSRKEFEKIGTKVIISDEEMVKICRDKNITSDFFIKCGLKAPMPVNDFREYQAGFPAFIKPKDGSSSINAYKIENSAELEFYADKIGDYVVQPFVAGKEFTIDIFCDWDGNPISIVPRERLGVRSGEVLKTRIFMDEKMISEAEKICRAFKPCGPLTVQLIRDESGNDYFIEINPRYGGGAPLSIKAGAGSTEAILKLVSGEKVKRIDNISDGAIYSRFDQSVCICSGKDTIKGVIFDLDDTLYSEKEYVRSGFRCVSDMLGGGYEEKLWNYFTNNKKAIDEVLAETGREKERDAVLECYRSHKPDIKPYEGVSSLIKKLKENNIKIGIITDGRVEGQRNKLAALGIEADDVIITDELGGEQFRKPCDIAFRIMKTRWKLPCSQMAYVGDNPVKDFQAPGQLGMKCIYFRNKDSLYYMKDFDSVLVDRIEDINDVCGLVLKGE